MLFFLKFDNGEWSWGVITMMLALVAAKVEVKEVHTVSESVKLGDGSEFRYTERRVHEGEMDHIGNHPCRRW